MKKIVLSSIMAIALIASTSVMAQDVTTSKAKKDAKTEVKKEVKAVDHKAKAVDQKAKAADQKAKEVKDTKDKKVQQTAVNHK